MKHYFRNVLQMSGISPKPGHCFICNKKSHTTWSIACPEHTNTKAAITSRIKRLLDHTRDVVAEEKRRYNRLNNTEEHQKELLMHTRHWTEYQQQAYAKLEPEYVQQLRDNAIKKLKYER